MQSTPFHPYNFTILICLLSCFILFTACKNENRSVTPQSEIYQPIPFDAGKWKLKEGAYYPHRASMYESLLFNDSIRTLKKSQIKELLGEPDKNGNNGEYLYYLISQKRLGRWPIHTRHLVVKFANENTVEWIKLHE